MEKYGFIYIWRDRKHKRYYVGMHWGYADDGYVCSCSWMLQAYKRRPQDFKRRILKKVFDRSKLRAEEQRWFSFIKKEELGKRYYNLNLHWDHWSINENSRLTVGQKIAKRYEEDPNIGKKIGKTNKRLMKAKWADPVYRESQLKTHWSKNGKTKEVGKKINTKERNTKIKGTVQALYDNGYQNPNKGKFWINNSIEEHYIKGDIPKGWTRGRIFSEARSKDMNKRWACPVYRQSMSDKHKGKRAWNKGLTKTAHSQ